MDFAFSYGQLKTLHVVLVVLAGLLMVARLAMALCGAEYRQFAVLRWLPHLTDTLLLAAAIGLLGWSGQYPFVHGWLTAKVFALIAYIIAASLALDPQRTAAVRISGGSVSVLLFLYIVTVAKTREVWPLSW